MTIQWFDSAQSLSAWVFALSLLAILYVYFGYPALLTLIAPFIRRRRPEPGETPMLSILIAAYNEAAGIGKKIQQTLALDYPSDRLEILVLSDASTDETDLIVQSVDDPRVRLLRMPERMGKTHAQNEGVKQARGEILVFSDATAIYHPKSLRYLACSYSDPRVGAVSGRYQYFDPQGNSPAGLGSIAFWNYENRIKSLQSRIKTISGCCGCIYSVRKSSYTPLPIDVISDLVQPLWILKQGYRVVFEDRALAYEETTQSASDEFAMRVRVVTRGMRGLLSVPGILNPFRFGWVAFQLLSHKVLRWMVPLFLFLLFASSALLMPRGQVFQWLFACQAAFYLAALVSLKIPLHRRWKPLGIPLYFCTLNAAACMSMLKVFQGQKYTVWQTVRK